MVVGQHPFAEMKNSVWVETKIITKIIQSSLGFMTLTSLISVASVPLTPT